MGETARAPITTILFTDVVDSTTLMQRMADERARTLFAAHQRLPSSQAGARARDRGRSVRAYWFLVNNKPNDDGMRNDLQSARLKRSLIL
jgi:hypothetical protein